MNLKMNQCKLPQLSNREKKCLKKKWAEPQNSVGQYKYINIYVIAVSERGARMVNTTPKIWLKN